MSNYITILQTCAIKLAWVTELKSNSLKYNSWPLNCDASALTTAPLYHTHHHPECILTDLHALQQGPITTTWWLTCKTKETVMGPLSKTSHLPPLQTYAGPVQCVNSVKLLGINLDTDFSWKSHVKAITSKATKTNQVCGCFPSPVAQFLHRGNQTCTEICGPSLESLAHENINWPNRSNTKASSQDHMQLH